MSSRCASREAGIRCDLFADHAGDHEAHCFGGVLEWRPERRRPKSKRQKRQAYMRGYYKRNRERMLAEQRERDASRAHERAERVRRRRRHNPDVQAKMKDYQRRWWLANGLTINRQRMWERYTPAMRGVLAYLADHSGWHTAEDCFNRNAACACVRREWVDRRAVPSLCTPSRKTHEYQITEAGRAALGAWPDTKGE